MSEHIDLDVIEDKATIQTRPSVTGPQLLALVRAVRAALPDALTHRGLCAHEHDPALERYHGCCIRCGADSPCETELAFAPFRKDAP